MTVKLTKELAEKEIIKIYEAFGFPEATLEDLEEMGITLKPIIKAVMGGKLYLDIKSNKPKYDLYYPIKVNDGEGGELYVDSFIFSQLTFGSLLDLSMDSAMTTNLLALSTGQDLRILNRVSGFDFIVLAHLVKPYLS